MREYIMKSKKEKRKRNKGGEKRYGKTNRQTKTYNFL